MSVTVGPEKSFVLDVVNWYVRLSDWRRKFQKSDKLKKWKKNPTCCNDVVDYTFQPVDPTETTTTTATEKTSKKLQRSNTCSDLRSRRRPNLRRATSDVGTKNNKSRRQRRSSDVKAEETDDKSADEDNMMGEDSDDIDVTDVGCVGIRVVNLRRSVSNVEGRVFRRQQSLRRTRSMRLGSIFIFW